MLSKYIALALSLLLLSCPKRQTIQQPSKTVVAEETKQDEEIIVRVLLSSHKRFTIECDSFRILTEETTIAGTKRRFSLEFVSGTPAVFGYYNIVAEAKNPSEFIMKISALESSGRKTKILRTGVSFANIDNSSYLLLEGPYETKQEAKLRGYVDSKGIIKLVIKQPEGYVRLSYGKDNFRLKAPIRIENHATCKLVDAPQNDDLKTPRYVTRTYKGDLEVHVDAKASKLMVINVVPLETYVMGVLPHEMSPKFPLEALKAQAILARTYAIASYRTRLNMLSKPYDFTDDVMFQVYGGYTHVNERIRRAVELTRGQVLVHGRSIVEPYFHASCGGALDGGSLWNIHLPYYLARLDMDGSQILDMQTDSLVRKFIENTRVKAYCNVDKDAPDFLKPARSVFRWKRKLDREALGRKLGIGNVLEVVVKERSPGGRVKRILVKGKDGSKLLEGEFKIRRKLSLRGYLPSALFYVEHVGRYIVVHGGGYGHGLGLCQYGAGSRALKGQKFYEILSFYFPGTYITRAYD